MATMERMHRQASCSEDSDPITDHENLLLNVGLLAMFPDLSQASNRKVIRWAVHLSIYSYKCIHLSRDDNVQSDVLSERTVTPTVRRMIQNPPLFSVNDENFERTSMTNIAAEQPKHSEPASAPASDGLFLISFGQNWIPQEAFGL